MCLPFWCRREIITVFDLILCKMHNSNGIWVIPQRTRLSHSHSAAYLDLHLNFNIHVVCLVWRRFADCATEFM